MQAIDILDSPLRWETERQNRIHQQALEQRKKSAPGGANQIYSNAAPEPIGAVAVSGDEAAAEGGEWMDYLFRVPAMRSALIPLDEASEGSDWSKPFALQKADVEPWLSFYKGYKQSRLFLEMREEGLQLDYPVRALLDLKRVPQSIILEPPVQIDSQVEYQDLEDDLRTTHDPVRRGAIGKVARTIHEKQLEEAIRKGREMGNRLYDALMGEGHVNLLSAWVKLHQRKPTVQELHQMLTTGRISPERQQTKGSARGAATAPFIPEQELPPAKAPEKTISRSSIGQAILRPAAASEKSLSQFSTSELESSKSDLVKAKPDRRRQMLIYLLHAAVSCAAIAAYIWVF